MRISDDVPVDEDRRDRALESFQTHYHPGATGSVSATALEQGDEELDEDEDGQDPGARGLRTANRARALFGARVGRAEAGIGLTKASNRAGV